MARIWAVALPRSVRRRASSSTEAPPSALGSTMPSGCAGRIAARSFSCSGLSSGLTRTQSLRLAVGVEEMRRPRAAPPAWRRAPPHPRDRGSARRRRRRAPSPSGPAGRRARTGASAASCLRRRAVIGRASAAPAALHQSAVRSITQTSSSRWLNMRCSKVTMPASGRELLSLRPTTSVSARSVSPMKTGLGIRTLS